MCVSTWTACAVLPVQIPGILESAGRVHQAETRRDLAKAVSKEKERIRRKKRKAKNRGGDKSVLYCVRALHYYDWHGDTANALRVRETRPFSSLADRSD